MARVSMAALALAAGVLVKLLPVAALPYLSRERARPLAFVGAVLLAGLLIVVPFFLWIGGVQGVGAGLGEYGLRWESTSLLFRWIEGPLGAVLEQDGGWGDPRRLARLFIGALWLGVLAWAWRKRLDACAATGLAIGTFLVLAPTLHPWYLTWLLPFQALYRWRSWTWLFTLAPLFYAPLYGWQQQQVWEEPGWLWPLVALPFLVLLALDLRARLR